MNYQQLEGEEVIDVQKRKMQEFLDLGRIMKSLDLKSEIMSN